MSTTVWKNIGENSVMDIGPDSYISYNPRPTFGYAGYPETALVFYDRKRNKIYYILRGDWRDAYQAAVEADGFGGALRFYEEHKAEYRADWSADAILEGDETEDVEEADI